MDWWWRKRNKKKPTLERARGAQLLEDLIECCDGKSNPIKFFSADEILKATDNFSKSNRISELDEYYNRWYSGKTKNHHKFLIKKVLLGYKSDYREQSICRDIAISTMVSGHRNFLKLVGCCLESQSPVMVYHGVKKYHNLDISSQPWKRRMKIADDIATALAYLHTAFPRPFVYRFLSHQNILLDEDGVAKLTDFSHCVLIPKGETFVKVDNVPGRYGYMDYDYVSNGVVSEKTDVFAIGMLMLMFLIGEKRLWSDDDEKEGEADGEGDEYDDDNNSYHSAAMSEINDQRRQFSEETDGEEDEADGEEDDDDDDDYATMWRTADQSYFIRFKFREQLRMDEVVDPEMLEKMGEISEHEHSQMKAFLMLSLRCIVGCRGIIPTTVEVAKQLKKIQTSLN